MNKSKSEIAYELLCRFEGLVGSVKTMNGTLPKGMAVRMKPLFISCNSCIEAFRHSFPEEYGLLNLEPLPLEDSYGKKLFTTDKVSTLLHQSEAVLSQLKGLSPYEFKTRPSSARESFSWYLHNTHPSIFYSLVLLILAVFVAGLISSETTLYKNTIKPFIIEYVSLKANPQINNTVKVPSTTKK